MCRATLLFTIATVKDVRDHCGCSLPFDPLQCIAGTNTDYHDIHHQVCTSWVTSAYRVLNSAIGNLDQVQLLTTVLHALGCPPWYEDDETGYRGSKKAQACRPLAYLTLSSIHCPYVQPLQFSQLTDDYRSFQYIVCIRHTYKNRSRTTVK